MKKRTFEDDGRTIADMSNVERPNLFLFRGPHREEPAAPEAPADDARQEVPLTGEERRSFMAGALTAAALIAAVFIAAGAVAIALMLAFWTR